jgi:magnesium transporter
MAKLPSSRAGEAAKPIGAASGAAPATATGAASGAVPTGAVPATATGPARGRMPDAPNAVPATVPGVPADQSAPEGVVRLAVLESGVCREWRGEAALAELPKAIGRRSARLWIDVAGANPDLKGRVAKILKLHPLLTEDIAERDQRAKLEQVGDLLHVVMFSLGIDNGEIYERELDFVLGQHFLLSNHSNWWDPRATRHLRAGLDDILARGPGYLLWALADDTIDNYFPILDQLGDEIDDLEDQVVARADQSLLARLFDLKRQLIQIRRVTSPQREMFNALSSREDKFISPEDRLYYRDAYDHLIRLTDELDTYRELASATLETYLSTVNNNLSLIMKRLTGVTVVVAGVGAIGGIFGMSEAQTAFRFDEGPGFWIVAFSSLVLAGLAAGVLRKIDWI